jgi:hypothetical protein
MSHRSYMTALERFEVIGDLYYQRHGRLRPGKSEAPESGRDSSSEENHRLFDNWIATQAFVDALDRINDYAKVIDAFEKAGR